MEKGVVNTLTLKANAESSPPTAQNFDILFEKYARLPLWQLLAPFRKARPNSAASPPAPTCASVTPRPGELRRATLRKIDERRHREGAPPPRRRAEAEPSEVGRFRDRPWAVSHGRRHPFARVPRSSCALRAPSSVALAVRQLFHESALQWWPAQQTRPMREWLPLVGHGLHESLATLLTKHRQRRHIQTPTR